MESHLLQMRGLKRGVGRKLKPGHAVASFTDAWIETLDRTEEKAVLCRIFYRCVD